MARAHIRDWVEGRVQNDGGEKRRVAAKSSEHRVVDREEHVVLVELVVETVAHEHLLNVALHERKEHTHTDVLVLFTHLNNQNKKQCDCAFI